MLKAMLAEITREKRASGAPDFVVRNYLKEYLQYPVLDLLYNSREYKDLIFTGGSCLRICFGAPRLSEDLDFDFLSKSRKKIALPKLAEFLRRGLTERYLLAPEIKIQGDSRIYLKFPVLKELGLAKGRESDFLYVKVEPQTSVFANPQTELIPVSAFGFNFVVKNYTLPFLFTGKISAFLSREWFKGKRNEVDVKGRDLYDLFWYLQKGVRPDWKNLKRLAGVGDMRSLRENLSKRIAARITPQKLSYDLKNFFPDQDFVSDFCRNYKKIMKKYLTG